MSEDDEYGWLSDAADSDGNKTEESQVSNRNAPSEANEPLEKNSAVLAAKSIQNSRNIESDSAKDLCRVLSDPHSSQEQIRSQLDNLIDEVEVSSEVSSKVSGINGNTNTRQLESVREELIHTNTDTGKAITDLLEVILELKEEVDNKEGDMIGYKNAVTEASESLNKNCQRVFRGKEPIEVLTEFTEAINNDEILVLQEENSIKSIVEGIEYEIDLQTRESENLLEGLKNPNNHDAQRNIKSALNTIDELSSIKNTVDEITRDDVLRRLDSIKSDLGLKDTPIYRHLEDRVRELEAMIDNSRIDPVQKYAIYQEITFYDRTLIPRLSRTMNPNDVEDIDQEITKVENRISNLKDNYVSVRADHNHSIPNHFITLTEDLCAQSRQISDDNADLAVGIITSSDKLLDYIEDLYEKNEYSVMLRRLRG